MSDNCFVVYTSALCAAALFSCILGQLDCNNTSQKYVINPEADVTIGVILPLRDPGLNGSGCGNVLERGIQHLEVLRWTLSLLNQNDGQIGNVTINASYIPGVQIGMTIEDSCSTEHGAVYSALDINRQLLSPDGVCVSKPRGYNIGMITGTSGAATRSLLSLLSTRRIPLVSYGDPSSDLSNYPYVLGATPDNKIAAQAIIKLVRTLRWQAISVVHSEDDESRAIASEVISAADESGVCTVKVKGLEVKAKPPRAYYSDVITSLLLSNVTGTIYVGEADGLLQMLESMAGVRTAGRLQIVTFTTTALTRYAHVLLTKPYAKGLLIVAVGSRKLPEFAEYWASVRPESSVRSDPLFAEWYMTTKSCRLPGVAIDPYAKLPPCQPTTEALRRAEYVQDELTEGATTALYTYVRALKNAHRVLCTGHSGLCPSLAALLSSRFFDDYVRPLNFTFSAEDRMPSLASDRPHSRPKHVAYDGNGRLVEAGFDLLTVNDVLGVVELHKIGYFAGHKLNIAASDLIFYDDTRQSILYETPPSACPDGRCLECVSPGTASARSRQQPVGYLYYPGTIVMAASLSIHQPGSAALSCGYIDSAEGVQFSEALVYVLDQINRSGILPKWITVGGVVLDDCKSAEKAVSGLTDLETGALRIRQDDGSELDPKSIVAYLSGQEDSILLATAQLSTKLSRPLLSVQSANSAIQKNTTFKYLAGMVPGISKQVEVLIFFLKQMKWHYVQMLYSDDEYGRDASKVFHEQATDSKICISSTQAVTDASDMLSGLREHPQSKVVVTFMQRSQYIRLVRELNDTRAYGQFVFLTDLNWRRMSRVVGVYRDATHGFITLSLKDGTSAGFLSHLRSIKPSSYARNPFFKEWYQNVTDCYLEEADSASFSSPCPDDSPITRSAGFQLNDQTINIMNAAYAVAWSMDATLRQYCGSGYDRLCTAFRKDPDRSDALYKNILGVWFNDDTMTPYHFTERSGNRPIVLSNINRGISVKIGEYNFDGESFFIRKSAVVNYLGARIPSYCEGLCTECVYLSHVTDDVIYVNGDVILGAVLPVHGTGRGRFDCSDVIDEDAVQLAEAIRYTVERINNGQGPVEMNGVTLGAVVVDGCRSDTRTANIISNLHSGSLTITNPGRPLNAGSVLSWLADDASCFQTKEVVRTLGLPYATLQGSGDPANGFLSMSPPYANQYLINALFAVLRQMNMTSINIISSNSTGLAEQIKTKSSRRGICVVNTFTYEEGQSPVELIIRVGNSPSHVAVLALDLSATVKLLQAREYIYANSDIVLVLLPRNPDVVRDIPTRLLRRSLVLETVAPYSSDFDQNLAAQPIPNEANPWLAEYFEVLNHCKLGRGHAYNETCRNKPTLVSSKLYKQSYRIHDVVNFVHIMADSLHRTLVEHCGQGYSGVCETLSEPSFLRTQVKKHLKEATVKNDLGSVQRLDEEGVLIPEYRITLYKDQGTSETRLYRSGKLSPARDEWNLTVSSCSPFCSQCDIAISSKEYRVRDGDIIIGGLFDVHKAGEGFTCDGINANQGYQLSVAFDYAIQYVNGKKGIFRDKLSGVTLGTISFDTCQNTVRAVSLLSSALSDALDTSDVRVGDKLTAVVGPFDTDIAVETSRILNKVGLAQVSYGSPVMGRYLGYPDHLLTAVPSVLMEARTITAVIHRLDASYVQVLYTESVYSRVALEAFEKAAAQESGICIAQKIAFRPDTDGTGVRTLLKKPEARVVVVLLERSESEPLLSALATNQLALQTFRFVFSRNWADNYTLLESLRNSVPNAVLIGAEFTEIKDFDNYLDMKTPESEPSWLNDYYEEMFACNLSSNAAVTDRCPTPYRSISEAAHYKQDSYVIHTINSVFAIALALDSTLRELCADSNGICQRFSKEKGQLLRERLKLTVFRDLSDEMFRFTEDGSSNKGFHVYTLSTSNGRLQYRKIGSYSSQNGLAMTSAVDSTWISKCTDLCEECAGAAASGTKFTTAESPVGLNIMTFIPVHKASANDPLQCGDIDTYSGFQNMLAFFYAIERINNMRDFGLPEKVKLGGTVVDTCGSSLTVLKKAASVLSDRQQRDRYIGFVTTDEDDASILQQINKFKPSVVVSSSLKPVDRIGDETLILRTKASEKEEGRAMAEIARRMSWVYVSVIRSNGYKQGAVDAFLDAAVASGEGIGVCVGMLRTMPYRSGYADALDAVDAAQRMKGANVLVLFTRPSDTRLLLRAVADLKLHSRFTFLAGTGWGDSVYVSDGLEHVAKGSIVVQSYSEHVAGFDNYVERLTLRDHGLVPLDWFEEFWQRAMRCRLGNATKPSNEYSAECHPDGRLSSSHVKQDTNVLYTLISTQVLAIALSRISECVQSPDGIAACLRTLPNGVQRLYEATKGTSWTSQPGLLSSADRMEYRFTEDGFGNLGLSVVNMYDDGSDVIIGHYEGEEGNLTLDISRYRKSRRPLNAAPLIPQSQCSMEVQCACVLNTGQDGTGGRVIRDADGAEAVISRTYYSNFSTSWGLAVVVLNGSGIAVALVLFIYLLVSYPDRGGTSVLGYLLLVDVMLTYAINFAFLLHPDGVVCDVRRLGLGLVYALSFACMLLKVLVIWQHEDADHPPVYGRLKHPASLFFVAVGLTLVQAAMAVEWVVLAPSWSEDVLTTDGPPVTVCAPVETHNRDLALSCLYAMLLMFMTLVFSALTYDCQENSRESRWIMAVASVHIITTVVWVTLSCTTDYDKRDGVIIVANLVNATVALLFIYIRKVYLMTKYVSDETTETKTVRDGTFREVAEPQDKEVMRDPAVALVHPNRDYLTAESVKSAGTSERFYFGTFDKAEQFTM